MVIFFMTIPNNTCQIPIGIFWNNKKKILQHAQVNYKMTELNQKMLMEILHP